MGAPTKQDFDSIVREVEAKGFKIAHADMFAHHRRMITLVVDEGDPDNVTIFEIWPEGLTTQDVADTVAACREIAGPGMAYEIGNNPRLRA